MWVQIGNNQKTNLHVEAMNVTICGKLNMFPACLMEMKCYDVQPALSHNPGSCSRIPKHHRRAPQSFCGIKSFILYSRWESTSQLPVHDTFTGHLWKVLPYRRWAVHWVRNITVLSEDGSVLHKYFMTWLKTKDMHFYFLISICSIYSIQIVHEREREGKPSVSCFNMRLCWLSQDGQTSRQVQVQWHSRRKDWIAVALCFLSVLPVSWTMSCWSGLTCSSKALQFEGKKTDFTVFHNRLCLYRLFYLKNKKNTGFVLLYYFVLLWTHRVFVFVCCSRFTHWSI